MRRFTDEEQLRGYPPTTLDLLGDTLGAAGAPNEAVAVYRAAQRLHQDDWLLNLGLAAWLLKVDPPQPEEAVRFYTAAAALRPEDVPARHGLANTLEEDLGRTREALGLYRELLTLEPDDAHLHWHRGRALFVLEETEAAIEVYRAALNIDPDSALAWHSLGIALGETDAAIEAYRAAVNIDPDSALAWHALGKTLLLMGQYEEALAPLEEAIYLYPEPENFETLVVLGAVLVQTGNIEGALAVNAEARRIRPEDWMANNNLGSMLRAQGDDAEAVGAFRDALRFAPAESRHLGLYNLGLVLFATGEVQAAITAYREALGLSPENTKILTGLARVLALNPEELREPEEAVELARKATELAPNGVVNWNRLGLACYRAGHFEDCLAATERSLASTANPGEVYCLLLGAMSHQQLGEHETARVWFARAVRKMDTRERPALEQEPIRDGIMMVTRVERPLDEDEDLTRLRAEAAALLGLDDN
jgi:superkiller protein 3